MVENVDSIQINFDVNSLWLVNITLAIIMFGVALDITVSDFKALFNKPKKVFVGILLQFFLVPAITLLLVYVIQPQASLALGLMMVAACPGGNVSNFMTKIAKGNTALSVSLTAFATAMALFITPVNLAVWANLYEPTALILKKVSLNPLEVTKIVLLILGIPLLIGMYIKQKFPSFAVKLSKIIKPLSFLILIAFIVVAFYNNLDIFYTYIHHAFYLVFLLNSILYMVGFYTAKMAKMSFEDQKTLSIETGIQNSGLGLMLVFLFFQGLGGMALVVAFWGIWDIFSGLVLAYYWSRKSNTKTINA